MEDKEQIKFVNILELSKNYKLIKPPNFSIIKELKKGDLVKVIFPPKNKKIQETIWCKITKVINLGYEFQCKINSLNPKLVTIYSHNILDAIPSSKHFNDSGV